MQAPISRHVVMRFYIPDGDRADIATSIIYIARHHHHFIGHTGCSAALALRFAFGQRSAECTDDSPSIQIRRRIFFALPNIFEVLRHFSEMI